MTKEFIPYEQALALKELGFNEPCFGLYNPIFHLNFGEKNNSLFYPKTTCSAPLYQQAFRWFREKYKLNHKINPDNPKDNSYSIFKINGEIYEDSCYWSYEEAELACLKKLIEILKNGRNPKQ